MEWGIQDPQFDTALKIMRLKCIFAVPLTHLNMVNQEGSMDSTRKSKPQRPNDDDDDDGAGC